MRTIMMLTTATLISCVLGATGVWAVATLPREPADSELRLGQRVRVDDGSCPAGQIKEVTAAKLTTQGVLRTRICVKK